jgi:hypothetical protein
MSPRRPDKPFDATNPRPAGIRPLVAAAAVGAGISGGVFFGFSTLVMPALKRLPQGMAEGKGALARWATTLR